MLSGTQGLALGALQEANFIDVISGSKTSRGSTVSWRKGIDEDQSERIREGLWDHLGEEDVTMREM